MILFFAFLASQLPALFLILWFRNGFRKDPVHRKNCGKALLKGALCMFPVLALSFIFTIIKNALIRDSSSVLYEVFHSFIVLALAEELAKYYAGRKLIKENNDQVSHLDVIIYMCLVGLGFEILESVVYAIGASVPVMLVRGITLMHGVFQLIMGYFHGFVMKKGKRFSLPALLIPWLFHGLYDFCVENELPGIGEPAGYVALALAFLSLVLVIVFIRFIRKARHDERYTECIASDTAESAAP